MRTDKRAFRFIVLIVLGLAVRIGNAGNESIKIDLSRFAPSSGKGTLTMAGGVLRMEVNTNANEFHASSVEFPVVPWKFLQARIAGDFDRGVLMSLTLLPTDPKAQTALVFTETPAGLMIGVPPGWNRAQLAIQLFIPGKSIGRTARLRSLSLETLKTQPPTPLTCKNMYWNGSFEYSPVGEGIPSEWGNWGGGTSSGSWSIVKDGTAVDGTKYLRVKSAKGTFIIPPRLPVEPFGFYRFRCRFRGTGNPWVGIFKQDDGTIKGRYRSIMQGRIGSQDPLPTDASIVLEPGKWREVSMIFSVEPGVLFATVYIRYYSGGTIDIDAVELLPIGEPSSKRNTR